MFTHQELHIPEPAFGSELTKAILELDHLRHKEIGGSTPSYIFFQLKEIFHLLESIGSARIEGNNTTIAEYIETKITPETDSTEGIKEIQNNEHVMDFIEEIIIDTPINHLFIQGCHKIIVQKLSVNHEGDSSPGMYRKGNVKINQANHVPPDYLQVQDYMSELVTFISDTNEPQYDLLKTAIAHHRFAWIHPFGNGNGRTVRAITYAMLIKQGFNVHKGRLINPTAVFCSDRDRYYDMLAKADTGTNAGLLEWCSYVLEGLSKEIQKIDQLTDYTFLRSKILAPTVSTAASTKLIDAKEEKVLMIALEKKEFQAADIKHLFHDVAHTEISRFLRSMKEKKLIKPISEKGRKYTIEIANGYLLRGVIKALDAHNFLPLQNEA